MALRSNALTTVDECKKQLDVLSTDVSQDAYLERLINSSSEQIERYCGRKLVSQAYTRFFDGNRSNELLLPDIPASAITTVSVDSTRLFPVESNLLPEEYSLVDGIVLRRHSGFWAVGSQNIKVAYTAGFAEIPADLEDACILLVELRFRMKSDRRIGRESQTKQGETISYSSDWPQEVYSLLAPYMLPSVVSGSSALR